MAIVVEQAQAARRAESLAQIRYREGSEDFLTLLDAQRTQLAADDALAAAEAEVNVSVVGVYKALGAGAITAAAQRGATVGPGDGSAGFRPFFFRATGWPAPRGRACARRRIDGRWALPSPTSV